MRNAFRLLFVAVFAAMALVVAASPAAAQESPLEVSPEGGSHCQTPTIVNHEATGNCELEVKGESIRLEGLVTFACDMFFGAYVGEDGTGYITHQVIANPHVGPPDACLSEPCTEETYPPRVTPWPIETAGETGAVGEYDEHLEFHFCLINHVFGFEIPLECELEVEANQISHQEGEFRALVAECEEESDNHVTGEWHATAHGDGIEFVHPLP